MSAPYEAKAIANFFLRRQRLTQVKLHRIVYFAHGWHLGLDRGPLLDEAVQAWRYGPVVPSLYDEFKWFGPGEIEGLAVRRAPGRTYAPEVDPEDSPVLDVLARVWEVYGPLSGARLSAIAQEPGSPWSEVAGESGGPGRIDIPDELLAAHFRRRALENGRARLERSAA